MEPSEKKARLLVQQQGDITAVSFLDQRILDAQTIDEITTELMALGQDSFKAKILVSFENVEYLSSTVLGKLV
ncbi:MAG: anti-sigma factor antagonist, partial [Planctomycetota bacterium]|nr:anti-sigma factor antagonist [Planctomycetota bacterium]